MAVCLVPQLSSFSQGSHSSKVQTTQKTTNKRTNVFCHQRLNDENTYITHIIDIKSTPKNELCTKANPADFTFYLLPRTMHFTNISHLSSNINLHLKPLEESCLSTAVRLNKLINNSWLTSAAMRGTWYDIRSFTFLDNKSTPAPINESKEKRKIYQAAIQWWQYNGIENKKNFSRKKLKTLKDTAKISGDLITLCIMQKTCTGDF